MKRTVGGYIDENGSFTPRPKEPEITPPAPLTDTSIDDLLKAGLQNIRGAMSAISSEINMKTFDRETIQNLKDLMQMLKDLKKEEKDFLDDLTDEQLEKLSKK